MANGVNVTSTLLYLDCKIERNPVKFLIDTGSVLTVVPAKYVHSVEPTTKILTAANGSPIRTYGITDLKIVIPSLRCCFQWRCYVADVVVPIIGADFLEANDLLVDLHEINDYLQRSG